MGGYFRENVSPAAPPWLYLLVGKKLKA